MKKRVIHICSVLSVIVLIALLCGCSAGNDSGSEDEKDSYAKDIEYLTKDVPTLFFFYGDEVVLQDGKPGRKTVENKTLSSLDKEILTPDDRAEHFALVIHDYYENAPLTDDDILMIKELVDTTKYTFIYIGRRYVKDFVRLGLFGSEMGNSQSVGFSVGFYERQLTYSEGTVLETMFTDEGFKPYHIGESVVMEVADLVRSCR